MFTLMVSYDCGGSYGPNKKAESISELRPRMRELDEQGLRLYLFQNKHQVLIAEEMGITQQQVSKDISELIRRWQASSPSAGVNC